MVRSLRIALFTCGGLLGSSVRPLIAQVAIPVGTPIHVVTVSELSSKTAKRDDTLAIVVQSDVVIDGGVVIRQGTPVHGKVTEAEKAGLFGHAGKLSITVDSLHTVDGQTLSLVADLRDTTVKAVAGRSSKDQAAANAVSQVMNVAPGADAVTGAFRHGDDITYKEHTLIPVFTVSYVTVAATAAAPSASQPPSPAPPSAGQPASGDSATPGIAAASIALFDAAHTWDRALGAMAAHLSTTPQVRKLGMQILREDSLEQSQGHALAAQFHTPVPVLGAADQTNLNSALLSLRGMHGKDFDKAVLQQLYDFESGFVGSIDTQDTVTPMGKLLNQIVPAWKGHMTNAAQLLVAANR